MIGPIKTVGIYVRDQERAVEFYTQKLGFEVRRTLSMGPGASWIEVAPPGAQTCLVLYPKAMMPDAGNAQAKGAVETNRNIPSEDVPLHHAFAENCPLPMGQTENPTAEEDLDLAEVRLE